MWHEKLKKPNKLGVARDDANYMKVWREKNRQKINEYNKQKRANRTQEEREAENEKRRQYRQQWAKNNPDIAEQRRKIELEKQWKTKQGIVDLTIERYEQTLKEQNNKCAICEQTMNKAQADHDHNTGKFRAILCWRCNVDLGHFEKNFNAFKKYIDFHSKV